MARSTMAQSSTLRAKGPQASKVYELGITPCLLTRPYVGLSPTTPQSDEGPRIEPPVSVPSAHGTKLLATAAPDPLLEPPVKCSRFHGLRDGGQGKSVAGPPCANSWVASFPT